MTDHESIHVVVAMDFPDELMQKIRAVSPRLNVMRHHPTIPDVILPTIEILYAARNFPAPATVPNLQWLQVHSAGFDDKIQHDLIQKEDLLVTSTSGIHARQIANYCLLMMLAFNYQLPKLITQQRRNEWHPKSYELFRSRQMAGQTVGLVGYGSIAREIARISAALGMKVLASKRDAKKPAENPNDYSPLGTGDPEGNIPERIYPSEALGTMAKDCDYLIVTSPLTEQTRHMVNERIFDTMKATAVLINIARGAVVDENALIEALKKGKIGGAALDVFETEPLPVESPLWQMPNVIISPHTSGSNFAYDELAVDVFIANLQRYLEKKPLMNLLNRAQGY